MNAELSRWFRELEENMLEKKKAEIKRCVTYLVIFLLLMGLVLYYAFTQNDKNERLFLTILLAGGVVTVALLIRLVIVIVFSNTKRVKKEFMKAIQTAEEMQVFDEELYRTPRNIINSKTREGKCRYIFTDHYIVHQFEKPIEVRKTKIVRIDKIYSIKTTVCFFRGMTTVFLNFYDKDNKIFSTFVFQSRALAGKFLEVLDTINPNVVYDDVKEEC